MDGVRVGNRITGAQAPVTIGWENIPRVEGGPFKQFFFTWFQPAALFALVAFWYYAPASIAKASTPSVSASASRCCCWGLSGSIRGTSPGS